MFHHFRTLSNAQILNANKALGFYFFRKSTYQRLKIDLATNKLCQTLKTMKVPDHKTSFIISKLCLAIAQILNVKVR